MIFSDTRGVVSNRYLKRKWDEQLETSQIATLFSSLLPTDSPFSTARYQYIHSGYDAHQTWRATPPALTFTEEEKLEARRTLACMGIPEGARYVCIGERHAAYRKKMFRNDTKLQHNQSRDTDFAQFALAAKALAERGCYVLRMGAAVDRKMPAEHPNIIDYASSYRSEFMDLYLGSTCHFFLTAPSGVCSIASIARRPIVFINFAFTHLIHHWADNNLFLFPHLYHKKTRAHLNLAEYSLLLQPPGNDWENYGILYQPNTPEEVMHAALEMDDRLSGNTSEGKEEAEVQERFADYLTRCARGRQNRNGQLIWTEGLPFRGRAASRFLLTTPEFLEKPEMPLMPSGSQI